MKKIKVAFIISNLGEGGAEKQLINLVANLNISVYSITVFLYACQKPPFYTLLENNTNIVYLKNRLVSKNQIFKVIEAILKIRWFLKNNKYDIIVSTLFMNNFLVRIAAPRYYHNKLVSNVRTSIQMYTRHHLLAEKLQIRRSYLVFNSNRTHQEFEKIMPIRFHSRLSFIGNGYETPPNGNQKVREFIFGSLGRFSSEKNILQSVRIFQKFEIYHNDSKLIIQGSQGDQYEEILHSIKSSNIKFCEKSPNIEKFYNSIRVLILPSLFEGCPNVLFEALLRRKLCIVSSGANSDDFIVDGITGFVYDGTDESLLMAMERARNIIGSEEEERIIEEGYNYAKVNFSLDKMVQKYENLFMMVYENSKSSN